MPSAAGIRRAKNNFSAGGKRRRQLICMNSPFYEVCRGRTVLAQSRSQTASFRSVKRGGYSHPSVYTNRFSGNYRADLLPKVSRRAEAGVGCFWGAPTGVCVGLQGSV